MQKELPADHPLRTYDTDMPKVAAPVYKGDEYPVELATVDFVCDMTGPEVNPTQPAEGVRPQTEFAYDLALELAAQVSTLTHAVSKDLREIADLLSDLDRRVCALESRGAKF